MKRELTVHGVYRHFKGNYYYVEGVARDSETGEECVVYRQLYGERALWVRPLAMFLSEVDKTKYPDAKQIYRFEAVSEDTDGSVNARQEQGLRDL